MKPHTLRWIAVVVLSAMALVSPVAAQDQPEPIDVEATLGSLEQVDDYPLYTMTYYGDYETADIEKAIDELSASRAPDVEAPEAQPGWGCSLFAAFADLDNALYGRNFDWEFSPALLLFTDPPDGYASVSMVDLAYFGFGRSRVVALTELSLEERGALLFTPFLPFDGMNEHGLVVGMAAVPGSRMRRDPDKERIGSIAIIREMLDHARNVDEATEIMGSYNIDMAGGPPTHYLIADASGRSALVEFYAGEMHVLPDEGGWQVATNFLRVAAGDSAEGECWRYDAITVRLTEAEGRVEAGDAMDILSAVSQSDSTQWSVVYEMSTGDIHVVMGRQYDAGAHTFHVPRAEK